MIRPVVFTPTLPMRRGYTLEQRAEYAIKWIRFSMRMCTEAHDLPDMSPDAAAPYLRALARLRRAEARITKLQRR